MSDRCPKGSVYCKRKDTCASRTGFCNGKWWYCPPGRSHPQFQCFPGEKPRCCRRCVQPNMGMIDPTRCHRWHPQHINAPEEVA